MRVVVPDLSNYLAAGDTVTLYWNAFPSDPKDDTPISGVEKTEHIVLGTIIQSRALLGWSRHTRHIFCPLMTLMVMA